MTIDLDSHYARNFSYYEMTRTSHRAYLAENREVPESLEPASRDLACLMQAIRDGRGAPVSVHSAYRCEPLNTAIRGSKNSQHVRFEACDFHVVGQDLTEVWKWIWEESGLKWGQLILEGWAVGRPSWIHVSLGAPYREASRSQQVLTFEAGKYMRVA